ncbi:DsbA family oxidoreductase [Microbacterium soli]|uniref:Protein disulfide isomerase FrnE n=1 Tax=Microbacterium soli TaxID=446075 RepID=A0ABP7NKJ1_9MICO
MSEPISIDIWSDVACPWCYIGKRNLEKGLAATAGDDDAPQVSITFHSFQLQPDAEVDFDGTHDEYLAKHVGMSPEQAAASAQRLTQLGAQAGLEYHFDTVKQTNTFSAHELLHFAKAKGLQHEMKERLMAAHFTEGRHVGHVDDLVELAVEVGLDADEVRAALEAREYADAVRSDIAQARAFGINGVPFFVIDGKYGVSGAQPPEAFENVIRDVWAKKDLAAAE